MKKFWKSQSGFAHHFVFVIFIVAFAVGGVYLLVKSHAATGPAKVTFNLTGLPAGQSINMSSLGHDLGYCRRSWTVTTSTTCSSGPNGSGSYYPLGTTANDTTFQVPNTILSSTGTWYNFLKITSGTTTSYSPHNPIYVSPSSAKTYTIYYQASKSAPTTGPASLTVGWIGLPAGTAVNFTATGHDIGYCRKSWVVTGATICYSGPNGTGGYYPVGSTDKSTYVHWPTSVTAGGRTYTAYQASYSKPGAGGLAPDTTGTYGPIYTNDAVPKSVFVYYH